MHFDKGTKLLDVDAIKYTASMVKESYVKLNSTNNNAHISKLKIYHISCIAKAKYLYLFSVQIIDQILSFENFSCLFRSFDKSFIRFDNWLRPKNAINRTHIYLKWKIFFLKWLHILKGNHTVALVQKVKVNAIRVYFLMQVNIGIW